MSLLRSTKGYDKCGYLVSGLWVERPLPSLEYWGHISAMTRHHRWQSSSSQAGSWSSGTNHSATERARTEHNLMRLTLCLALLASFYMG